VVYVVELSPPATEETGAMGREIESRPNSISEHFDIFYKRANSGWALQVP
jgi:hypothetical protein